MRLRSPHLSALLVGLSLTALTGCAAPRTGAGPVTPQPRARAQDLMDQAQNFEQRGLSDSALAAFGMALLDNPNIVQAHMGMGEIYQQRHQYELARRAYARSHELAPDRFDTNYNLALMNQVLGRTARAISLYLRALAIDPDSAEANRALGSAYLTQGQADSALPYARKATELDPDNQGGWVNLAAARALLGQSEDAIDAYREAAELGPLADAILPGLADAHLRLGHYYRAVNVLRTMLRRTPSADAHERLGYAYFKLGRYEDALAQYNAALELAPDNVAALNGKGVGLMTRYLTAKRNLDNQKDLREMLDAARAAWRRSLRIRPNQPRIIDLLYRYRSL